MDVRKLMLPAVQKNRAKKDSSAAYAMDETGDGAAAATSNSSDMWLDRVEDIREYDVPYHQRIAIDTGRRVGKWYTVREEGGERAPSLTPCEERKAFGEPRVLAFDIECVKQPLKFPDATVDPVMMISYMMDGVGYLIINREVVSEDIADFDYNPKPDFPGPFSIFNEQNEEMTLRRFFGHLRQLQPHVIVTYNGDNFDWPYIDKRAQHFGMNLKVEVGFAPSTGDNGAYYVSTCMTHIDCIHWVKRDSYLPAGSHGLKAVCRAKLGYDPLEIDPEQMTRFAIEQPQLMSSYSVSDAVATYYLYMKYVHGFIFSLATVIPMSPDEVLRKGSGTLCESLLMVEAYAANVICPNKQVDDMCASHEGSLLESETYVGGHVECLQTGIYRNDIPVKFKLVPAALQGLIDRLDETLAYQIELDGVELSSVTNYDEVKGQIVEQLEALRDDPNQAAVPVIYHLDVGAMYPNIILTNRLQPPAIVSETTCASCVHNKPESDCKRPMKWMWRGELFPASTGESDVVRATLEYESVPNPFDPGGAPVSFLELGPQDQNQKFRSRLKEYCQKVYKKTHVTKMEERTAVTCQRENPFYIDTVRAFRDRRYEYKKLNKTWGKKRSAAEKSGDGGALMEAKRCACCTIRSSWRTSASSTPSTAT
jgi:DNA polymerase epsilon subunit 1